MLSSEEKPRLLLCVSSWEGTVNAGEAASHLRGKKCSLVPQTALTRGFVIYSLGMLQIALSLRPLSSFFAGFT